MILIVLIFKSKKKTHTTTNFFSPNPRWQVNLVRLWDGDSNEKTKKKKRYTSHNQALQQVLETLDSNVDPLIQTKNIIPTSFSFWKSLQLMFCSLLFSAVCVQLNPLTKMIAFWNARARKWHILLLYYDWTRCVSLIGY